MRSKGQRGVKCGDTKGLIDYHRRQMPIAMQSSGNPEPRVIHAESFD